MPPHSGSPPGFIGCECRDALVGFVSQTAPAWCQQKAGKELSPSQREALKQALASRVLIITGGPGMVLGSLTDSGVVPACASFLRQRDVNSC